MKKYKLYRYYQFGYNYRILLQLDETFTNEELYNRLKEYLEFLDELNLSVTKSGVRMKEVDKIYEKIKTAAEDLNTAKTNVAASLVSELYDALSAVDSILDAELNIKVGFVLDEKRYSNEILTTDIHRIFADKVYEQLSVIAQEDFREVGLCLAFDRYTAAAFHALRGTEEVLKLYYSKLLNKTPSEESTWGTFLNAINKEIISRHITPVPSSELMINLENLRNYHRNKTQHPIKNYSCDDAQDLIGVCVKTINEIIADLQKRSLL